MKIVRCKFCNKQARHTGFKYGMYVCADCFNKRNTSNATPWIDKVGFPIRKEYKILLEVEDKQGQIFEFSWLAILFLFILLIGVIFLAIFVHTI